MALLPDASSDDSLPGGGGPSAAPTGWPSSVPYPGRGTPLDDVAAPPSAQPGTAGDGGQAPEVPGTDDQMAPGKLNLTPPQIRQIHDDMMNHQYSWHETKLSPQDEAKFQREVQNSAWYKTMTASFGHPPSLNDPSYDYRGAWKNGEAPMVGEQWPTGSKAGDQTYLSPTHPYVAKHFVQQVTGIDASEMHSQDVNTMLVKSAMDAEQKANGPAAGYAWDPQNKRLIKLSPNPKDAVDPRPKPLSNNRISRLRQDDDMPVGGVVRDKTSQPPSSGGIGEQAPKKPRRPEDDEPGTLVAHHETSETVEEPGTGEGRNVYGRDQGGLAGKPLPGDKERYPNVEDADQAAAERSRKASPEDENLNERGKRARAKNRTAFLGMGGTATDAGGGAKKGGYGPGGQYTKDEWDYMQGAGVTPGSEAAPPTAAPKAPAKAQGDGNAPATVGESRKTYMQRRLKEIEEGK